MNINRKSETYEPPFTVVLCDALDAYYYADIFEDKMYPVIEIKNFNKAKAYADALFVIKNYSWDSLEDMNELDSGYDVRVFDKKLSCVYAAHESFKDRLIGENS